MSSFNNTKHFTIMPVLWVPPRLWFFFCWAWQSECFSAPCHDWQTLQHKSKSFVKGSSLWQALRTDHFLKLPQTLGETRRSCMLYSHTCTYAYKRRGPIIGLTHLDHDHAKPIMCHMFQVSRYSEVCDTGCSLSCWMDDNKLQDMQKW